MSWTDERVETLKKMWSEGQSASQIAKELGGVTRNAVIGKVHRLGLSNRAGAAPAAATSVKTHALLVTFASPQDQSDKHVGRMTCTIHRKGAVWESLYQLFRGARMFLQARLQVGLRLILWPCRTIGKAFDCDIPALPIEGKP